jgi:hypothetical protein
MSARATQPLNQLKRNSESCALALRSTENPLVMNLFLSEINERNLRDAVHFHFNQE